MSALRTCETCGQEIPRHRSWTVAYYARRRYCDMACRDAAQPCIAEDYAVTDAGCWEWQGAVDRNGYGKAYDITRPRGQRVDWAHRVSYRRRRGEIPAGHEIDHLCQNTVCINPDHLEPVTKTEHAQRTWDRLGAVSRQRAAAHLRETGLTYREIGEALGGLGKDGAHRAVVRAIERGLVDPDSLPPVKRVTEAEREDMRMLHDLGVPQTEIGAWYGIDSSQVSRICNGRTSRSTRMEAAS